MLADKTVGRPNCSNMKKSRHAKYDMEAKGTNLPRGSASICTDGRQLGTSGDATPEAICKSRREIKPQRAHIIEKEPFVEVMLGAGDVGDKGSSVMFGFGAE